MYFEIEGVVFKWGYNLVDTFLRLYNIYIVLVLLKRYTNNNKDHRDTN